VKPPLQHPELVLHQLDRAAEAIRKNDPSLAIHHLGNAVLMLKQAIARPRPAKRRAVA
jgi:hypothetical protein